MALRERVLINGADSSVMEARVREFLGYDRERRLVVDVGSNETPFRDSFADSLHVFIDPAINGEATTGSVAGARIADIRAPIESIAPLMYGRADRVQIIAPDPEKAMDVVLSSLDMVKKGGRMVVAFDALSRKGASIPGAADMVKKALKKGGFFVTMTQADQTLMTDESNTFDLGFIVLGIRSKE